MCSGGDAEEGDVVGVTSKGGDVVAHPFEEEELVLEAEVEGALLVAHRRGEETEGADAVVEGHGDQVLAGVGEERGRVVHHGGAAVEGAAVDVHADGEQVLLARALRPEDVGREAVLAVLELGAAGEELLARGDGAELGGVDRRRGRFHLHRGPEPAVAGRRLRVRDAAEGLDRPRDGLRHDGADHRALRDGH